MAQAQPDADSQPASDREMRVRADVRLLVARDAPGDIVDGARALLGRVDAVTAVEDLRITGMRPGLNDLRVEAAVTLRLAGHPADPAATLIDGFGVDRVTVAESTTLR
jgi:hypothetical protein